MTRMETLRSRSLARSASLLNNSHWRCARGAYLLEPGAILNLFFLHLGKKKRAAELRQSMNCMQQILTTGINISWDFLFLFSFHINVFMTLFFFFFSGKLMGTQSEMQNPELFSKRQDTGRVGGKLSLSFTLSLLLTQTHMHAHAQCEGMSGRER